MRYILSLKHAEDEAWIFEEEGPLFGEMNDVQHNGEDAVKNRGFELVTLDGVYHFSFTNPYKVNMKVLMNMAEVDPMELLKIVPDETAIPNLKKVKVSTQKFGELTVVLSENQTKLVNFAFHPEAELQGLYPSKKEIETLNDFAIKKYKMRAVIYSEQWSTEESNRFVEAAKAYTSGQFFTEMFHYGFLELASGKGVVMFEDPNLNKSLAGSLEDRITSTIGSVCS
jgi:hypothetical protein